MKDRVISIRVSPEEYKHFSDLAKKDQRSLSDFMRIFITSKPQKKTTKKKEPVTPKKFRDVWWQHWGRESPSSMKNKQLKELYKKTVDGFPGKDPLAIFEFVLQYVKNGKDEWLKVQDVNVINQKYESIIKQIQSEREQSSYNLSAEEWEREQHQGEHYDWGPSEQDG